MRQTVGLVLALLVGIAIGAGGIPAIYAQTGGSPTYVVADMKVTQPAPFTEYMRGEPATLAPFHGRVAARGLPTVLEGPPPAGVVTIYQFPNPEDANHWYYSEAYAKLKDLRQQAATTSIYFLTGVVTR